MENRENTQKTGGQEQQPFPRRIGPLVLEIGHSVDLTTADWEQCLSKAFKRHRKAWGDTKTLYGPTTIHGYLYGKPWPYMECEVCLSIIADALKLSKVKAEQLEKTMRHAEYEITQLYDQEKRKIVEDAYTQAGGTEMIRAALQHLDPAAAYAIFKNLDACLSLNKKDIAFWKFIMQKSDKWKESALNHYAAKASELRAGAVFQLLSSEEAAQWIALRDRDYSETLRKSDKSAKAIAAQAEKRVDSLSLTQTQLLSFQMMIEARQTDGAGPLYSPADLNLLILFKYCFSDEGRIEAFSSQKEEKKKEEPEENV